MTKEKREELIEELVDHYYDSLGEMSVSDFECECDRYLGPTEDRMISSSKDQLCEIYREDLETRDDEFIINRHAEYCGD